ncbi:MAG: amidohydrolase [Thermoanaerobaculia bacterium]|nr:amidohydrolase [Thermoanaerobaculia bacterium]
MRKTLLPSSAALSLALLSIALPLPASEPVEPPTPSPAERAAIAVVEARADELIALSDEIWAFEETAFEETESAAALAEMAETNGFRVDRGVAEIPTAFVAEFGEGRPIVGILGEFDALPGLSQKPVSHTEPANPGGAGHGCGHNVFGVASLGAAIAVKELIETGELEGTVRFYGTPAEERFFGKLWMIREGLFDDLDVIVDWHPGDETKANVQSSLALVDFVAEFEGQAAHGAADPWNGRSAGDALELYTTGINYYREHVEPTVRMHYHIQDAGKVVNVVPDYARIFVRVRDTDREGMQKVWKRVEEMAEGAAILADVTSEVRLVSGVHELVPNRAAGARVQENLEYLGAIEYTDEEQAFAREIQEATGKEPTGMTWTIEPLEETQEHPGGGSTDAGDVSFVVPMARLSVAIAPEDTPWHSWAVVAYAGMSIGHKGLVYAAKALAMTMVDLFEDAELREAMKAEHAERVGDYDYEPIIPPGPPPLGE